MLHMAPLATTAVQLVISNMGALDIAVTSSYQYMYTTRASWTNACGYFEQSVCTVTGCAFLERKQIVIFASFD